MAALFYLFFLASVAAKGTKTISVKLSATAVDNGISIPHGRVLVFISKNGHSSLIDQCSDDQDTSQVFGVDVHEFSAGDSVEITPQVLGYPVDSLSKIPDGEYFIQAQLLRYDEYHREHETVILPVTCVNPAGNDGEYGAPAGSLFSSTEKVKLSVSGPAPVLILSHEVPHLPSPGCSGQGKDSDYIKTVRVKSALLSQFWGRPITIEACVLLPYQWHEHPNARYPIVISQGHYSAEMDTGATFSEHPPAANLTGYAKIEAEAAYELYQAWTSASDGVFYKHRALLVTLNHDNPFFDDSYAVNSANVGPYGDALVKELIPAVEKQYRGLGAGWARGLFGGSTGGWISIGVQVKYPDDFNGCHAACPDPVSFTSYATVNIYNDSNAYYYDSDWKRTPRPAQRDHYSGQTIGYGHPYGQTTATVQESNHRELVLGPHSSSCGQWDIWEAVFGPKGADGYPERIWNKLTGEINHTTAAYWRENFDLKYILERDWHKGLGQKMVGKIHLYVGNSDTFFLTNAVMDLQDFLETTKDPPYNGSVLIGTHRGRGFEHCFNGYGLTPGDDRPLPNSLTRLRYANKFVPELLDHFAATAPPGSDTSSWRY